MDSHKKCSKKIVEKTMKEYEKRKLKQSDDKIIKNRKQAIAIALSKVDDECKYTKSEYEILEDNVEEFFNTPIDKNIPLSKIVEIRKLIEYYYSKKLYKKCHKYEVLLWHYIIFAASKGIEISDNIWKELKAIKKLDYKRF